MRTSVIAIAGVVVASLVGAAPAAATGSSPAAGPARPSPGSAAGGTVTPVSATDLSEEPARRPAGTRRDPWRVMFVGDSLIHGQTAMNTARFWVWRELRRQGVGATFVGPRHDLSRARGRSIYNRRRLGFQAFHAALAGSRFRYHLNLARKRITYYRPGLIVLQLGFNDAKRHLPARIARDTVRYLRKAWAVDPSISFVVGQIPPTSDPRIRRRVNPRIRRTNRLLKRELRNDERVAIARTQTSRIMPWHPPTLTFDGTHPNATGETLLAHRYGEAMHELRVLPRPPKVARRLNWRPAIRPRARGGRGVIRVNLRHALRVAYARTARVVVRGRNGVVRRTPHLRRRAVRIRVPRGRYTVRMQLTRGTMRGATRITRVRVR